MDDVRRRALKVATASRTATQAVADSGLVIQHRRLTGLLGVYYPVRIKRPHGLLALNGEADERLLLLALAHLDLGHDYLYYYAYGPGGEPLYDSPRDQLEAQEWANEFQRATGSTDATTHAERARLGLLRPQP